MVDVRPRLGKLRHLEYDAERKDIKVELNDVLQVLTFQVRVGGQSAVRRVRAEHVEVTVLEAAFALVEHGERLLLVLFQGGNCFVQHGPGFLLGAELRLRFRTWY